jgi:hypothetical protein
MSSLSNHRRRVQNTCYSRRHVHLSTTAQPGLQFAPTDWFDRAAHALTLDYQGMKDKIDRGEIEQKIATGKIGPETGKAWYDEAPNRVF